MTSTVQQVLKYQGSLGNGYDILSIWKVSGDMKKILIKKRSGKKKKREVDAADTMKCPTQAAVRPGKVPEKLGGYSSNIEVSPLDFSDAVNLG